MSAIIYLLQVSACLATFYVLYRFLLNKLTFFTINRWYLLVTLLLSFIIPVLTIPIPQPQQYSPIIQQVIYVNALPKVSADAETAVRASAAYTPLNWLALLKWGYLLAVGTLLAHLLMTLALFFKKTRLKKIADLGHVHIIRADHNIANGSFLNYIFLNEDALNADEIKQVVAHEMLHVALFHSADRIIAKIAQIMLWFNPFVYLYIKAIEENHEFEVDREIASSTDKGQYADLLLHLSVAGQGTLYHNFSKVPLKKRITMLFNKPSTNMTKIMYLLIVPVLLLSCLAFARLKADKPVPKFSVIDGVEILGKDPLVLIDGQLYKKEMLYRIGSSCIKSMRMGPPNSSAVEHGVVVKDGFVEIKTRNHVITYITALEKENLIKERSVPKTRLYTRISLKNADGSIIERIIVHIGQEGSVTRNMMPNEKACFLIDSTFYDETTIKNLSPKVIKSLSGAYGVSNPTNEMPEAAKNGYAAVFTFHVEVADKVGENQQMGNDYDHGGSGARAVIMDSKNMGYNDTLTHGKQAVKRSISLSEYAKTDDYKQKVKIADEVNLKTVIVKIKDFAKSGRHNTVYGFLVDHDGRDYVISFGGAQQKFGKIKIGDVVSVNVIGCAISQALLVSQPIIMVPGYIIKNNIKVFEAPKAAIAKWHKWRSSGVAIGNSKLIKQNPLAAVNTIAKPNIKPVVQIKVNSSTKLALVKTMPGDTVNATSNIGTNAQVITKVRVNGQTVYNEPYKPGEANSVTGAKHLYARLGGDDYISKIKLNRDSIYFVNPDELQLYNAKGYRIYSRARHDSLSNAPNYVKTDALGNMSINGQPVTKLRINGKSYHLKLESVFKQ